MSVAVTVSFLESAFLLDKKIRKAIMDAISQLDSNPDSPSLSCHRINKLKCDPSFWSARVNDDVRIIYSLNGDLKTLLYVDHHDDAYHWCEGKYLRSTSFGASMLYDEKLIAEVEERFAQPSFFPIARQGLLEQKGIKKKQLEKRKQDEDPYVRLARYSLESYITLGKRITKKDLKDDKWKDMDDEMYGRRAGTFVSIHKDGALRGCIGTILPTTGCIADEIMQNAISAATNDPRFPMIKEDELPYLEISVDVLDEPEPIDSPDELDVRRYGVIVTHGRKRGLLLPNLDGVDSIEQQIDIARQKAGIYEDEDYSLERFEVIRHY